MPFNGGSKKNIKIFNARDIEKTLRENYSISKDVISNHGETSTNYIIPGFKGKVGIIPAFSRTFCNTCNRLRITAKGEIKTCLYDNGVFSIRELIRSGSSNKEIKAKFIELIKFKPENGFEAEKNIKNKSFITYLSFKVRLNEKKLHNLRRGIICFKSKHSIYEKC